jgi:hypothetical protein
MTMSILNPSVGPGPAKPALVRAATHCLFVAAVLAGRCAADDLKSDGAKSVDKKSADRLFELHLDDAAQYDIFRDQAHSQRLELRRQPVYVWSNPTRSQGQTGAVFVWTFKGRPEAIASIFSHPEEGQRVVCHELLSLSTAVLDPQRASENRWQPRAGLALQPLPEAPPPAESSKQRQFQLRALSRDFSAHSIDYDRRTWELRLLPKALLQYESSALGILDGALFAFVTDAGTDPEVLVVLEARRTDDGPQWQYAVARFSDLDLYAQFRKKEVWTSIRSSGNSLWNDPEHRYRLYRDRIIDEIIEVTP